jgi:hypothetical protein
MYYAQSVDGVLSSTLASQAHDDRAIRDYFKAREHCTMTPLKELIRKAIDGRVNKKLSLELNAFATVGPSDLPVRCHCAQALRLVQGAR